MNMGGVTTEYDSALLQIGHYKNYPKMLPWIGRLYGKIYRKVLFIGESHYLPDYSTAQLDVASWYSSGQSALDSFELSYIDTRNALLLNYRRNGIWRIPAQLMSESGITPPETSDNVYEHFCYYNFFQRPAEVEVDELHITEQDCVEANKVFLENLTVLAPEIVLFMSSKSWNAAVKDSPGTSFLFVPHPSSNWWNRKSHRYAIADGVPLTGKEKFIELARLIKND